MEGQSATLDNLNLAPPVEVQNLDVEALVTDFQRICKMAVESGELKRALLESFPKRGLGSAKLIKDAILMGVFDAAVDKRNEARNVVSLTREQIEQQVREGAFEAAAIDYVLGKGFRAPAKPGELVTNPFEHEFFEAAMRRLQAADHLLSCKEPTTMDAQAAGLLVEDAGMYLSNLMTECRAPTTTAGIAEAIKVIDESVARELEFPETPQ